jgi:ribonucleoside-diphosphate reductase subunit M2
MSKSKDIAYYVEKITQLQKASLTGPDSVKRYALFPILDEGAYEFYTKQEITHWTESELDFTADRQSYDQASPQVKKIFDTILAFFLSGDGAISENIVFRFLLECKTYEEKAMFISQLHIELIHAATYGLAAFTFKRDPKAMAELIESVEGIPCVSEKMNFMDKWTTSSRPRYQRLVAFACAEGIFFCTLFAVIFWFRSKGWFPNFILANELIANDESLHRDWGAYLFGREINELLGKYDKNSQEYKKLYQEIKDSVYEIVLGSVAIEDNFADYILSDAVDDLDAKGLKMYARLIADNLLVQLGYSTHFNAKNPFTWLDDISMEQKGNFYEVRVGSYQRNSLSDVLNWRKRAGLVETTTVSYDNPEEVDF